MAVDCNLESRGSRSEKKRPEGNCRQSEALVPAQACIPTVDDGFLPRVEVEVDQVFLPQAKVETNEETLSWAIRSHA